MTGAGSTSAPATSISVPPPSMLRGKTIEEIVNKWSSDLETNVKEFSRLATEIAVWDRALIANGNTVSSNSRYLSLTLAKHSAYDRSRLCSITSCWQSVNKMT